MHKPHWHQFFHMEVKLDFCQTCITNPDCCCCFPEAPHASQPCGQCSKPIGICKYHLTDVMSKYTYFTDQKLRWVFCKNPLDGSSKLFCSTCVITCHKCKSQSYNNTVCTSCFKVSCEDCGKFHRVSTSPYHHFKICIDCNYGTSATATNIILTTEVKKKKDYDDAA